MANLPDIIAKGKIEDDSKGDKNTKIFIYKDLKAVVPMVQYINKKGNVKRSWILTLYEKYDK